jgi:hypothetical protein|tara:strand:- start:822 stop:1118 length:297 start_codon:yes stop_codon:yes gene_type:complete
VEFKPGDIVACVDLSIVGFETPTGSQSELKRWNRFIVLEIEENDVYAEEDIDVDGDDFFLSIADYARVYCYAFEDKPCNIGETFYFDTMSLVKIPHGG